MDGNGEVFRDEILEKFAHAPAEGEQVARLFDQMDNDASGGIDIDEFLGFWSMCIAAGKSVKEINAQLDTLMAKVDQQDKLHRENTARVNS